MATAKKRDRFSKDIFRIMRVIGLWSLVFCLWSLVSSCIRLVGTAGYTHQGSVDESPKTKSVSFDTQDVVQPNRAKGNITIAQ